METGGSRARRTREHRSAAAPPFDGMLRAPSKPISESSAGAHFSAISHQEMADQVPFFQTEFFLVCRSTS